MKKNGLKWAAVSIMLILSILFNAAAWISRPFSDYYTDNIFPKLTEGYSRFTSLFPFSVGEIMLVVLVVLVIALLITLVLRKFFLWKILPVIVAVVVTIMSLNCFVLYHCTPMTVAENTKESYDLQDLAALRDFIVTKCNELSLKMPRDSEGNVVYQGDMKEMAKKSMLGISDRQKRLDGFYATPKALTFSGFMSQQYMQGYYFPFSMEANYNDDMYIMNKPFTICHELAHTHGYIYEDEANFLGFLSCIESEDPVFEYSGYLGVLNYVNNDFYKAVDKETYDSHVKITDLVKYDNQFLTDEAWKKVEDNAIFDTETVKKAADTFVDTNLKVNGVSSGKVSYTHVVSLLLDFYNENPFD
jgi:hypothetical protein